MNDIQENDEIRKVDGIGELKMLGQGNTAEIFQYGEGKILKLFREYMPMPPIENEYRASKIIQEHLDSVPRVYELIEYNKRYGIVYEQIIGNEMLQLFIKNISNIGYYARQFASIHVAMHKQRIDVDYSVKEKLSREIDMEGELTADEKDKLKQYLMKLPDGNTLCHFDFQPGNVLFRNNSPVVIDWMTACTGDAAADVARTVLLMEMGEIMFVGSFKRHILHLFAKRVGKKYYKEYQKLTGIDKDNVNRWKLPVAAARLYETLTDHERVKLAKFVRKEMKNIEA